MKRMKDVLIGMMVGLMLSAIPAFAQPIAGSISVVWNAINVQLEGQPVEVKSILHEGSTYLPMRKVAELVGKDVEWISETMTANITERGADGMSKSNTTMIDGVEYYSDYELFKLLQHFGNYSLWPNGDVMSKDLIFTFSFFEGARGNIETRLIESVPYVRDRTGVVHVRKDYYEQTILPLIR